MTSICCDQELCYFPKGNDVSTEGNRPWWGGWASNPVGGAMRRWVGSTPASFRHYLPCMQMNACISRTFSVS